MTQDTRPSAAADENPFFRDLEHAVRRAAVGRIRPEHFLPAYERAFAEHEAEIAKIAGADRAADLRQHHRRAGECRPRLAARRRRVRPSGRHRLHRRRCWRSSATSRRAAPRTGTRIRMNEALFARLDALHQKARQPRPHARAEARAGAPSHPASAARARRSTPDKKQAACRDRRAAGGARHRVQPERAGRRAVLHDGAGRRGRSRRPAGLRARRGEGGRRRAQACPASMSSPCSAPASSRSCNSRRAAICAKRRSAPGSPAATATTRPTTRR